jgi:hypothetical protein
VRGVDGEEPEVDVGVLGMTAVLDLAGLEAADDGAGTGGEEGEDVAGVGPARRRIAARREGDGDAGEPVVAEGAVDGPAVASGDVEGRAVIALGNEASVDRALGPNGKPAGRGGGRR